MKLVVGLGNPGIQYSGTRHNIGFDVISVLASRMQAGKPQVRFRSELWEAFTGNGKVLLATPLTFMNLSGEAVQQIVRFFQVLPEEIVVICDDMNLPTGQLRWRSSGSAGGQKGLEDILKRLGTDQVPRLRIGIGRPPGKMDPVDWVLGRYRPEEKEIMEFAVAQAADSIELWLAKGVVAAMNQYNRSSEAPKKGADS
jgi:peptidyl-tRNA hydrolase, PTH1 family